MEEYAVRFIETHTIITKQVLNTTTGELEAKDFCEVKNSKQLKGGFSMVYKSYDEVLSNCIKSNLDWVIILHIREQFTYARIEVVLSPTAIAKELGTSKQKVTETLKHIVYYELLLRVSRGIYRLNPFMYLPVRSNGAELQKEWVELEKH